MKKCRIRKSVQHGFSLGELLIVITIIVLLAITVIIAYKHQIAKANDATRKEHLNKFRIAFEDYYNDNGCYPTEAFWNSCSCEGDCLSPYMEKFLCDPTTRQRYFYKSITDAEGNPDPCSGYLLYARLENKGDPDIIDVGCSPTLGCGYDQPLSLYNYGISVGGSLTAADFNPNPTKTPTPTKSIALPPGCESASGPWSCNTAGTCNYVGSDAFTNGRCSVGFVSASCCQQSLCPEEIWCAW